MPRLSRRGFIALGGTGAAGAVLAGCGAAAEPREEGDDAGLLDAAVTAESAYRVAVQGFADQQGVSAEIEKASAARLDELRPAAEKAGGEAALGGGQLAKPPEAAAAAIAAYRQGARELSTTELRTTATQFLAQVAGELAALRELDGQAPVPYAFVTGLDEKPLQSADDAPTGATTSTTTTTTSTGTGGE